MQEVITQAHTLIDEANTVLIATQKNPSNDAVASALALHDALIALGKKAQVVVTGDHNERLAFLPSREVIKKSIHTSGELHIHIDTNKTPVDSVRYDLNKDTGRLTFFLETDEEKNHAVDHEFISGTVDLVITVGVPNIEQLSDLQEQDKRLLFDTPIISIDNNAHNSQYGQVHVHKITSASLAEIVTALLDMHEAVEYTEQLATTLLTGVIAATRNFESARTTPDSFSTASTLLEAGADQQAIIKNLYRTKTIGLLKLWGRALGKLSTKSKLGVVYTYLTPDDFTSADATQKDVAGVVEEIATSVQNGNLALLLWQTEEGRRVRGIAYNGEDTLKRLSKPFNGVIKNGKLVFRVQHRDFEEAEKHVFGILKEEL